MVLLNTYLILCNAKCNANGFKYKKSPLNKGKKRSARRGSNPRPPPWQGGAPPLSHSRIFPCIWLSYDCRNARNNIHHF